jgi:hypothetical protein
MNVAPRSSGARTSLLTGGAGDLDQTLVPRLLSKGGYTGHPGTFIVLPPRARCALRSAQTPGFLDLGGSDRPRKRNAQLLGRLQRKLDRDPCGRPKL